MAKMSSFEYKQLLKNKNDIKYQPRMILEDGNDITLGSQVDTKEQAIDILEAVKRHAKINNPDRFDDLSFYIQECK